MAVKEWVRRLQPAPLYLTLALTALFFVTQLAMSHMTHALTLLVDAYHMLCNLIALAGCIITIKYGSASEEGEEEPGGSEPTALACHKHESAGCSAHHNKHYQNVHHKHQVHTHHLSGNSSERRLKNTFGWARIDVLVMLIGCVFLTSLCFSLVVEALQTLIHIEHHDEMHHPIPVLVVGCVGLLINGLCYFFIGGYTFHQASFLHVTPEGEVVLDHVMNQDSVRKGQRRLSAQTRRPPPPTQYTQRQGPREMCRDVIGCIYVIVCALIVYLTDKSYAKFVDPILSIVSAITLLILSYPYMRESGSILLQTIPDSINIDSLRKDLLKAFPDILNVHDLHVWRLTASRVFSTAHIIFLNNRDYTRITKEITNFFHNQGITQVTIQPEFFQAESGNGIVSIPNIHDDQCLVPCLGEGCYILHCCANNVYKLTSVTVASEQNKTAKGDIAIKDKEHPIKTTQNNIQQQSANTQETKNENLESPVIDDTILMSKTAKNSYESNSNSPSSQSKNTDESNNLPDSSTSSNSPEEIKQTENEKAAVEAKENNIQSEISVNADIETKVQDYQLEDCTSCVSSETQLKETKDTSSICSDADKPTIVTVDSDPNINKVQNSKDEMENNTA